MADRYWVGGTANWDSTAGTKWSATSGGAGGQTVPTSGDAVFFTNLSTGTCTVAAGGGNALSINCTGFTGTIAGTQVLNVSGSVTLVAGMTFTHTGGFNLLATGTLTTGGKTVGPVTITASGGTVTLGGALTLSASSSITLTTGTFTTSGSNFAITANRIILSGTGAKVLTLNGSTVSLSLTVFAAFDYTGSNLTFNAGTSTINFTGGVDTILNGGAGLTFHNVAFTGTSAGARTVSGANTFNQLTITAPASAGSVNVGFGANQTITTLIASGASLVRRIRLEGSTANRTLTVGTYTTKENIDFRDIVAAGASAPWSGTSIGNCLRNSNITFTAAKTVYWNLTGAQNWSSTGWATTSGGTPAAGNFPLAQDTAIFDNAGAATSVDIDSFMSIATINASARTSALTLSGGISANYYGDFINGSGVTISLSAMSFRGAGTQTITSAGATFPAIANTGIANTLSLGSALICTGTLSILSTNSFNANTYAVTVLSLAASSGSVNLGSASWTVTGAGSAWNTSASSSVSGTAEIILSNNTTTARTFAAGINQFGKLTIGGNTSTSTTTISGGPQFLEIASTKTVAHTIVFPNTTTTVTNFTVRGTPGNVVTLSRTGASGTFTLLKSGAGIIESDYLSISNSTVSPIDTWYAGANSTNGGGNTNWIFTAAPVAGASKFLAFFI
jgi:hypothetical protein